MTGKAFIDVANELAAGASEAHWRSATSRAYYAAYHVAKEALEQAGIRIPAGPSGHEHVKRCLDNSQDYHLETAGNKLGVLRSNRIRADYRLASISFLRVEAQFDVAQADVVIRNIEESPLRTGDSAHVAEVIEEYLRKTNQWRG